VPLERFPHSCPFSLLPLRCELTEVGDARPRQGTAPPNLPLNSALEHSLSLLAVSFLGSPLAPSPYHIPAASSTCLPADAQPRHQLTPEMSRKLMCLAAVLDAPPNGLPHPTTGETPSVGAGCASIVRRAAATALLAQPNLPEVLDLAAALLLADPGAVPPSQLSSDLHAAPGGAADSSTRETESKADERESEPFEGAVGGLACDHAAAALTSPGSHRALLECYARASALRWPGGGDEQLFRAALAACADAKVDEAVAALCTSAGGPGGDIPRPDGVLSAPDSAPGQPGAVEEVANGTQRMMQRGGAKSEAREGREGLRLLLAAKLALGEAGSLDAGSGGNEAAARGADAVERGRELAQRCIAWSPINGAGAPAPSSLQCCGALFIHAPLRAMPAGPWTGTGARARRFPVQRICFSVSLKFGGSAPRPLRLPCWTKGGTSSLCLTLLSHEMVIMAANSRFSCPEPVRCTFARMTPCPSARCGAA
jgi:hypothetical protein